MRSLTFVELLQKVPIFRVLNDALHLYSPMGKKLLQQQMYTFDHEALHLSFNLLENTMRWYTDRSKKEIEKIQLLLFSTLDISNTLLRAARHDVLDEIELFEIKKNALALQELSTLLVHTDNTLFSLHDLTPLVSLLDPDATRLPHFYLYDSYHPQLSVLRKALNSVTTSEEEVSLQRELMEVEHTVLQQLSEQLIPWMEKLQHNLAQAAALDLGMAKSALALQWGCSIPAISTSQTAYKGLFHPVIRQKMVDPSLYQSIDLTLTPTTYLITGANMAGKTVLLKSVSWAQFLFQFGFAVPASEAKIVPVEEIFFSSEEMHTELSGLSSFAAEILQVNYFLQEAKKGRKLLILIDELARTTNPEEGTALVTAYSELMRRYPVLCIITSHYNTQKAQCKKLRIKGLQLNNALKITPKELSQYMDYQPVESDATEVPTEALRIAEVFEVDKELIDGAYAQLKG